MIRVRRGARNKLPNMPPPTGLEEFWFRRLYNDGAPTALDSTLSGLMNCAAFPQGSSFLTTLD